MALSPSLLAILDSGSVPWGTQTQTSRSSDLIFTLSFEDDGGATIVFITEETKVCSWAGVGRHMCSGSGSAPVVPVELTHGKTSARPKSSQVKAAQLLAPQEEHLQGRHTLPSSGHKRKIESVAQTYTHNLFSPLSSHFDCPVRKSQDL